jgi:hypothetical protein
VTGLADQTSAEMTPEYRQSYGAWLNFTKLMRWVVVVSAITMALMALFIL